VSNWSLVRCIHESVMSFLFSEPDIASVLLNAEGPFSNN
jgi:hypothetical protein